MEAVVKSQNDFYQYRVIALDNKLTALLISDPTLPRTTHKASASAQHQLSSLPNGREIENQVDGLSINDQLPVGFLAVSNDTAPVQSTLLEASNEVSGIPNGLDHLNRTEDPNIKTKDQAAGLGAIVDETDVVSDDGDSSWTDVSSSSDDDSSSTDGGHLDTDDDAEDRLFVSAGSAEDDGLIARQGRVRHSRSRLSHGCDGQKLSAAGLCVGVGSFSDPDDIPGLAHFLEHMVSMGSEKYPDENDFESYLSEHGGSSNAYTECEQTVFHFEVQRDSFHGALDRFAQFFIRPLMKKDSVDREIEAVDSEFLLSLTSDEDRIEQLLSSIANKDHPMSKFMWGNVETLRDRPSKQKIDIYRRLQKFREEHYLPQYMTLAVLSQDPLDQLETWVRELFKDIPASSKEKISFSRLPPPFSNPSFNRLYRVVPMKAINQVILTWALPSQLHHYKSKPLHYLGWLVGHEGKGSLAAFLRRRHWALAVESGNGENGMEHNTSCSCFSIQITLSDDGLDHLREVIGTVFEYLAVLHEAGPQLSVFNEIKTIEENEFRWKEPEDADDYVEDLCSNMQLYPVEHYVTGSELMFEYDAETIRCCTDLLTADRVNVVVLSSRFAKPGLCGEKEKWFKTAYRVDDIPSDWMPQWSSASVNPELSLPPANEYIAEDFSPVTADVPDSEFPVVVMETHQGRLWYRKDNKFNVPRAYVYVYLLIPSATQTARNLCLLELFVQHLLLNLSEVVYDASIAQLSYDIKVIDNGLTMEFGGFSDKLPKLFHTVVDHMADFSVSEKQFDVVKLEAEKTYENYGLKPEKLNRNIGLSLLKQRHWLFDERLTELADIDCNTLVTFVKNMFSKVYFEGLAQGNITAKQAKDLHDYLVMRLNIEQAADTCNSQVCVSMLPSDTTLVFRTKNKNPEDTNSVITNYYQHGPANVHDFLLMELLLTHMEEPCFDRLRTRKQLGYDVNCGLRNTSGILGYSVTVNSPSTKFTMKQLDDEIEAFLKHFWHRVEKMKPKKFQNLVMSAVKTKCIDDTNLEEEIDRNWVEILDQTYLFNRTSLEIEMLKTVTIAEFKQWASSHLQDVNRKKLGIQIVGNKTVVKPAKKKKVPTATLR